MAARLFAMQCLNSLYDPSMRNKTLYLMELAKLGVTKPLLLARAWPLAQSAYRRHKTNWQLPLRQAGTLAATEQMIFSDVK
jgi:hypothetical protein